MCVGFFTPICFVEPKKTFVDSLIETVDDYFDLQGEKACVIKEHEAYLFQSQVSLPVKILKITSYFFVFLPLFMLVLKSVLRRTHKYTLIDQANINKTALTLQKTFRGYINRKQKDFYKIQPFVDHPELTEGMAKAKDGRTIVLFPKEAPTVVIKVIGSAKNAETRRKTSEQARLHCRKLNIKHLIVPQSRIYRYCLIEERLPLKNLRPKVQIGFYLEHKDKLNEVVREFTRFYCSTSLGDILHSGSFELGLAERSVARYDNIPFFLDKNNECKIGLPDLEDFSIKPGSLSVESFRNLIDIFPCHLEIVIEEGKKYYKNIESFREVLEKEQKDVIKFFKLCYQNHRDHLKKNEITLASPTKMVEFSMDRLSEVKQVITDWMMEIHHKDRSHFCGLLGEHPKETLALFNSTIVPEVLNSVISFVTDLLHTNTANKDFDSYEELVMARTLEYEMGDYENFSNTILNIVQKNPLLTFKQKNRESFFSDYLVDFILEGLAKVEVISSFHSDWNGNKRAIFC